MLRVLVLFSDPPGEVLLRLDREDKAICAQARKHEDKVQVVRLHASEVDDIHDVLLTSSFDVIQFSGHGNSEGIVLDRADLQAGGEQVSAERLATLLNIAEQGPRVVILLCCYASDQINKLAEVAPFLITTDGPVPDEACIDFVHFFYERLFAGFSVQSAFENAMSGMKARGSQTDAFSLDRRCFIRKGDLQLVEIRPSLRSEAILVNIDKVVVDAGRHGLEEEDLCYLLRRKLKTHLSIFDIPRDNCVIPIGRSFFGEFSWVDSKDTVSLDRIFKLRADADPRQWKTWMLHLTAYNDLASRGYRNPRIIPESGEHRLELARAVSILQQYVRRYIIRARDEVRELGLAEALPNIEFIIAHAEAAADQLQLEQFAMVNTCLEEAVMNYHELVDRLRPPEE